MERILLYGFIGLLNVGWSLLRGDHPRPTKQWLSPLFLLALATKEEEKWIEKKRRGKLIFQFEKQREKQSVLKEVRANSERKEKNGVFHIVISVWDWRVIYGPILIKFQYVIPNDEGYAYWCRLLDFLSSCLVVHPHLVRPFLFCWNISTFKVMNLCLIQECVYS
jgi:hypothetical protein